MKPLLVFLSAIILFNLAGFANAGIVSITDNFDNPADTIALWSVPFGGTWTHPSIDGSDLGYYGVVDSGSNGTAVFVSNQQFFNTANLLVNVSFRLHSNDSSTGFLIIDRPVETSGGTYNEYGIFASKNPGESDGLKIWHNNVSAGGETNTSLGSFDVNLSIGTFYRLQLLTDSSGNITLSLFNDILTNPLLGALSGSTPISFSSGILGIASSDEATFNNFSLTGNAVPIPGTVFLFGLGILSFAGISRRKVKE